jgi:chromosomal replication initiation ATPase DnaA
MIHPKLNYWVVPAIAKIENFREPTLIKKAIKTVMGISELQLESKSRKREIVEARQIYCYLMRKHTDLSLKAIGATIGGRDHSTVIHSLDALEDRIFAEEALNNKQVILVIEQIENQLIIL